MNYYHRGIVFIMLLMLTIALAGCQTSQETTQSAIEPIPHVITSDIQAGIEAYIEEQTLLNDGYFLLTHQGEELRLKLVRVHTEYLANLGPRRHFACIDLASIEGNVYDVDFFLSGDPGNMDVTETTIHKINGQPYYVWKQNEDDTWARESVDDATKPMLGVIEDFDQFEFLYQTTLPELTGAARMWIPLPKTDSFQTIELISLNTPGRQQILSDTQFGNTILFLELTPSDSGKPISLRFNVERHEKAAYPDDSSPSSYLAPDAFVPVNEEFRKISSEVLVGKKGDLVKARALYDHTIDQMRYAKFGDEYGKGDAVFACDSGRGNCTDYHSYFIALSRAAGIPARFAIGAAVPSARDDGQINGYHCWAEFYAEGKWWPIDISEADKYSSLSTYYFGHNPANRVELSKGRDLVVDPGPASGPINFLAYPLLEVAGKPVSIKPKFSFKRSCN